MMLKNGQIYFKSCGVITANFLKYVRPLSNNIIHERAKMFRQFSKVLKRVTQQTLTCSNSTLETLEKE